MVYIFLGNGFEEVEAITICDLLRRGGVEAATVSVGEKTVLGAHGVPVVADLCMEESLPLPEMVVLPGGLGGVASISDSKEALSMVESVWNAGGYVTAICVAPTILAKLGITDGRQATCYPGLEAQMGTARMQPGAAVVQDDRLITGQAPGAAIAFSLKLVETLRGQETAKMVAEGLVLRDG